MKHPFPLDRGTHLIMMTIKIIISSTAQSELLESELSELVRSE